MIIIMVNIVSILVVYSSCICLYISVFVYM